VLSLGKEKEHLDWIQRKRIYYMPLRGTQSRQYVTRWVAIYSSLALRTPGAVTHKAAVSDLEVKTRQEILTPWRPSLDGDQLCVVYRLQPVQKLELPIENTQAQRVSTHRWTSRLALDRAKTLEELLIETEPEWRLYERLVASRIGFRLAALSARVLNEEEPVGRAWFWIGDDLHVRYTGASGFLVSRLGESDSYFSRSEDIAELVLSRVLRHH
jgi:hypothetical protein